MADVKVAGKLDKIVEENNKGKKTKGKKQIPKPRKVVKLTKTMTKVQY